MRDLDPKDFPPVTALPNAADRVNDDEEWRPLAYDPEVAFRPRRTKRPPSEFSN